MADKWANAAGLALAMLAGAFIGTMLTPKPSAVGFVPEAIGLFAGASAGLVSWKLLAIRRRPPA